MLGQDVAKEEEEGLYFLIFGKHRSWSDHIEDIGIVSPSLREFKRWLYLDGVRSAVESGEWAQLLPEERIDEWNHRIILKGARGWIFAVCVQSPDAKGRKEYPLVAALHVVAEVFPSSVEGIWATLGEFCNNAVKLDSQDLFQQSARNCYEQCLTAVSQIEPIGNYGYSATERLSFVEGSDSCQSRKGLAGILYRFSADLVAFVKSEGIALTRFFRVSSKAPRSDEALKFFELIGSQISENVLLGWLQALDDDYADIIVGPANPRIIANMKLSKEHSTPLSEVSFNLSEKEIEKFQKFLSLYTTEQDLSNLSVFTDDCFKPKKSFFGKLKRPFS